MSHVPPPKTTHHDFADLFLGLDKLVPLLDGTQRRYINFDNAASTPPMRPVYDAVNNFMPFYSSVHRGTGFKSQLSTRLFEEARHIVLAFVGADPEEHTCIFGKNTTEALNKLARRFPFTEERNIVLTTAMEHHSNDLPWRYATETHHIGLHPDGQLDEAHFDQLMTEFGDRVALVALTGASNVSGFLNPAYRIAEKTHAAGAQIVVDCAQYAPHRKVDMRSLDDPTHFDFVTIAAHKMYAPYGTGALIGRKDIFNHGQPDMVGGGTVEVVTLDEVEWASAPERDEAGSPNTVGAIALAAAIKQLEAVGMDAVAQHEAELTAHALTKLRDVPGIEIYGDTNPETAHQRLGVIPFNIEGMSHFLVASILGHEFGIGVRNGCFCAHPYILYMMGIDEEEAHAMRDQIMDGDHREKPGLIRASFGLYNTLEEVDAFVDALHKIVRGEYAGEYIQDKNNGEYHPIGWNPDYDSYFSFEVA
jgi:selenocysteine lyase/cysteine desulfurase